MIYLREEFLPLAYFLGDAVRYFHKELNIK